MDASAGAPALVRREFYSAPPPVRTWLDDNPTLLLSWWITLFSLTIILFRLAGRWLRTERLFLEDKIMALSIIPLFVRMGFAHMVLRNGTNNTITDGLDAQEIANREFGSRMVLAARIFYAMFIWTAKLTVTEFLNRLCESMWKKSWKLMLNMIRGFLALTFIAVVIATLTECHPLTHYWQVVPDPGPQCRQAYIQLLTMGGADMLTDLILMAFPIFIIFQSNLRMRRKLTLSVLFAMSFILIIVAGYRVAGTMQVRASQQFRTLLASLEILAATFVSNALVLGSFMRDKGVKKGKYSKQPVYQSVTAESALDRPGSKSRPRGVQSWGSDVDLVDDVCMRLGADLESQKPLRPAQPAPVIIPGKDAAYTGPHTNDVSPTDMRGMDFTDYAVDADGTRLNTTQHPHQRYAQHHPAAGADPTPRRTSFFDVGGLLDGPSGPMLSAYSPRQQQRRPSHASSAYGGGPPLSPTSIGGASISQRPLISGPPPTVTERRARSPPQERRHSRNSLLGAAAAAIAGTGRRASSIGQSVTSGRRPSGAVPTGRRPSGATPAYTTRPGQRSSSAAPAPYRAGSRSRSRPSGYEEAFAMEDFSRRNVF